MKHTSSRRTPGVPLGICLAMLVWFPADALAAKTDFAQIVANIDLSEEGKKVPRPTPEQPAYYVPVIFGWQERGKIVAGEKPPARQEMIRQLGRALAKEGYVLQALRPDADKTLPSLILAIEWGYVNPSVSEHGALDLRDGEGGTMSPAALRSDPTQTDSTDLNQSEMITLVAGAAIKRGVLFSQSEWEKLRDAVSEDRYFIMVSAYDFTASLKGEQKLLWRARMSTERQGVWMDDVVPALVAAGAPMFGRQMDKPQFVTRPVREGKVEVGTPTVVETEEPSASPDGKSSGGK